MDTYEDKHRLKNQTLIEGIPVNPTLRPGFDDTDNAERDPQETKDWWGVPYIITNNGSRESYSGHIKRMTGYGYARSELDTEETFLESQEKQRKSWLEAWPEGTRYDVSCLDGGAWDRSTSWGMFKTLNEALAEAKTRKPLMDSPDDLSWLKG